jgi:hypothetical protein
MRYEIKELNLGGILDHSISLLKNHFKLLSVILASVLLPVQVVSSVLMATVVPNPEDMAAGRMGGMEDMGLSAMTGFWVMIGVSTLVFFLFHSLAQGAVTWGIAEVYLGKSVTAAECIKTAFRKWPVLITTAIVNWIGIVGGSMLCLVPGIYLVFAWFVIYPVLMIEGLPMMQVFGRSRTIMKGHKGKAFVVGLVLTVIGGGIGFLADIIPGVYPSAVLSAVIQVFLVGFNCIVVTVVYFSGRCLVENFDLELLAGSVARQSIHPEPL